MSPLSTPRPLRSLLVLAALVLLAAPAAAQEIAYTTVTRGEFGGSMGSMMSMIPGANDPTRETVYVKGSLMRTDSEESSTIVNAAEGIISTLQHDERTYFSLSMEEMAEMAAAMSEGMMGGMGAQGFGGEQPQFQTQFDTETTGRTQDIGGYEAHEVLMTVEMGSGGGGMGMGMGMGGGGGGSMVLFPQLWISSDVPGYEALQAAQSQMGQQVMRGGGGGGFSAAFASDPRMQQAFEENKDVLKDMEGLALKTVSAFVTVPEGMEFDRDAVLASLDEPLDTGGGMDAAGGAAAAMKSLGGMFGRRGGEEEEEAGPQVQTVTMRTISTIEDIRTSGIADDLFTIPEGYTKIDPGIGGDWIG